MGFTRCAAGSCHFSHPHTLSSVFNLLRHVIGRHRISQPHAHTVLADQLPFTPGVLTVDIKDGKKKKDGWCGIPEMPRGCRSKVFAGCGPFSVRFLTPSSSSSFSSSPHAPSLLSHSVTRKRHSMRMLCMPHLHTQGCTVVHAIPCHAPVPIVWLGRRAPAFHLTFCYTICILGESSLARRCESGSEVSPQDFSYDQQPKSNGWVGIQSTLAHAPVRVHADRRTSFQSHIPLYPHAHCLCLIGQCPLPTGGILFIKIAQIFLSHQIVHNTQRSDFVSRFTGRSLLRTSSTDDRYRWLSRGGAPHGGDAWANLPRHVDRDAQRLRCKDADGRWQGATRGFDGHACQQSTATVIATTCTTTI